MKNTKRSEISSMEKIGIDKALKTFGGFVRYYDTTEPLAQLADLVSSGKNQDILACCGGGDQALTMLGAGQKGGIVWAVDINPAQLFVLAAKAHFLDHKNLMPSFKQLQRVFPGRISDIKREILSLHRMQLYHKGTGKLMAPPAELKDKYALVTDGEMYVLPQSGPYWQKDASFKARVRARLGSLRFARMDVFDSPDHFKIGSLDLIYISDIYWPEPLAYYQVKLAKMAGLLRPGGRIITCLDEGDDYVSRGVSPGRLLEKQAKALGLRIDVRESRGYLVLERLGSKL